MFIVFESNAQLKHGEKPQPNTEYIVAKSGYIRNKPYPTAEDIGIANQRESIFVLDTAETGYLKIKTTNNVVGYLNEVFLIFPYSGILNVEEKPLKKYVSPQDVRLLDIQEYGSPNQQSKFNSDGYKSEIYTWYCAKGKYRKIDYVHKNGEWERESEFESNCLN